MKKEIFQSFLRQAWDLTDNLEKAAEEQQSQTLVDILTTAKFAFYAAKTYIKETYEKD